METERRAPNNGLYRDAESKPCVYCGREFGRTRFKSGRLEDHRNFAKRKYCSLLCRDEDYRDRAKTERSEQYRDHVLGSCGACAIEGPMHVHHVDGDHENDDPSNLQTLCAKCHGFWHATLNRTGRIAGRMPRLF